MCSLQKRTFSSTEEADDQNLYISTLDVISTKDLVYKIQESMKNQAKKMPVLNKKI